MTEPSDDIPPPAAPVVVDEEWLYDGLPRLQRFTTPDARATVRDVLERLSGEPVDVDTADRIIDTIFTLLGDQPLADYFLNLLARGSREPDLIAAVQEKVDDELAQWIRTMVALYGDFLYRSRLLGGEESLGWSGLSRWVTYNYVNGEYRIKIELRRNAAETVDLIDSPANIWGLAITLVETVMMLPPADRAATLDPQRIEDLREQCVEVAQSIHDHQASQEATERPDDGEPAGVVVGADPLPSAGPALST